MKKLNVILADDHPIIRDGLEKFLSETNEFTIVASCKDGLEVFNALERGVMADLMVLDIDMPGMDGYSVAQKMQKEYSAVKIIVLSLYGSEVSLIRLLRMGVRAVLKKDAETHLILEALRTVAKDGYYYCSNHSGKIASFFQSADVGAALEKACLTDLEINFLKLAATDLAYKSMADELGQKAGSMDRLRVGVFEKLGVSTRVGLVIYAIRNGIVIL